MGKITTVGEQMRTFPQEGTPAWGCWLVPGEAGGAETMPGPQVLLGQMYDSAGHSPHHAV